MCGRGGEGGWGIPQLKNSQEKSSDSSKTFGLHMTRQQRSSICYIWHILLLILNIWNTKIWEIMLVKLKSGRLEYRLERIRGIKIERHGRNSLVPTNPLVPNFSGVLLAPQVWIYPWQYIRTTGPMLVTTTTPPRGKTGSYVWYSWTAPRYL